MPCTKHIITNACGHDSHIRFALCAEHYTVEEAEKCFGNLDDDQKNVMDSVMLGTKFCNRGCKAISWGWRCCTCRFDRVQGYRHPLLGMAVHDTVDGQLHAFCISCGDAEDERKKLLNSTSWDTSSDKIMPLLGYNPRLCDGKYEKTKLYADEKDGLLIEPQIPDEPYDITTPIKPTAETLLVVAELNRDTPASVMPKVQASFVLRERHGPLAQHGLKFNLDKGVMSRLRSRIWPIRAWGSGSTTSS